MSGEKNAGGLAQERSVYDDKRWRLTVRDSVIAVVVLHLLLLIASLIETAGYDLLILRPILAVVTLSLGPGLLILILLGIWNHPPLALTLYSVGLSTVVLMLVGVTISLFYPLIGISQPISDPNVLLTLTAVIIVLAMGAITKADSDRIISELRLTPPTAHSVFFLSIPFFGILAIESLNRFGNISGVILFLILLSLIPLITLFKEREARSYPLAVWGSALGLLYFKSLWWGSYPIEMWMHQMVIEQGRWVPVIGGDFSALPDIRGMGQEGVLTDAILYPIYSLVAGIETITVLEVVNPIFVSLIPLSMYETFRRYISKQDALLSAFVFTFTYRFFSQHYPNGPRDVMATLFIVLITLLIADPGLDERIRRGLAAVFSIGLIISHYGTLYLFIAALALALVGFVGLKLLEEGFPDPSYNYEELVRYVPNGVIGSNLVTFLSVTALSWYLFTAGGIKFDLFVGAFTRIMSVTQVSGLASERVLSERPFSIDMTRNMIVVIFVLISFGVLTETIRKLRRDTPNVKDREPSAWPQGWRPLTTETSNVSDEHLVIAAGIVGVFALTFTGLGTGFGQGRILMLSLSLSSIFLIIGLHNINYIIEVISERIKSFAYIKNIASTHYTAHRIRGFVGIFLCVFLLINSGVVAETITRDQDYAATTIINNDRLSESSDPELRLQSQGCIQCDIGARVWVLRYGLVENKVYHGGFARSHYWYGHSVVTHLDGFVTDYLLINRSTLYWSALPPDRSRVSGGSYLVLTSDNYDSGKVVSSGSDETTIRDIRPTLNRSDRLYTSGGSTVHWLHPPNSTST